MQTLTFRGIILQKSRMAQNTPFEFLKAGNELRAKAFCLFSTLQRD